MTISRDLAHWRQLPVLSVAEAAELEARGQSVAAERVIDAPMHLPAVRVAAPPKTEGVSTSRRYWAEVVDIDAFLRGAIEGKVPMALVIPDQKALDALARASKEALKLTGVIVRSEAVVRAQGR